MRTVGVSCNLSFLPRGKVGIRNAQLTLQQCCAIWKLKQGLVLSHAARSASGKDYSEEYQALYEEVLEETSTGHSPWYVLPADQKWYTRYLMAELVAGTLEACEPRYPEPGEEALLRGCCF